MNGGNVDDPGSVGQDLAWEEMFNFESSTTGAAVADSDPWAMPVSGQIGGGTVLSNPQAPLPWSVPIVAGVTYPPTSFPQGNGTAGELRPDQTAISSALMNFIADMSRNST
jgi:hypothetical protein